MSFTVTRAIVEGLQRQSISLLPMVMRDYRESGLDQRAEVRDMLDLTLQAKEEIESAVATLRRCRDWLRPGLQEVEDPDDYWRTVDTSKMQDRLQAQWIDLYRQVVAIVGERP